MSTTSANPSLIFLTILLVLTTTIHHHHTSKVNAITLCNMNNEGLNACKPFVTKQPPPLMEPSKACCEALKEADLKCLCSYKNSLVLPSLGIDPELAMELPSKCNLSMPEDC